MGQLRLMPDVSDTSTASAGFVAGVLATLTSVFVIVVIGTFIGIGALAHEFGFSVGWTVAASVLIWAAPAQVILVSALGGGATPIETALAVTLSSVRLLPMVVALLPLIKSERTRQRDLILPAHFTAISMWVEALRLLPQVPRENRIAFCNGIGTGFVVIAMAASVIGYYLAGGLPWPLAAMLLFLTPMSFLVSVIRNSRLLADRLAFVLGFVIGPLMAWGKVDLALLWTGLIGGTAAYATARLAGARKGRVP
jgi:predicted branched-subunit amino acid permease